MTEWCLFELSWAEEAVVVTGDDFLRACRQFVHQFALARTVAMILAHTVITAEEKHVANLILAVVVMVTLVHSTEVTV